VIKAKMSTINGANDISVKAEKNVNTIRDYLQNVYTQLKDVDRKLDVANENLNKRKAITDGFVSFTENYELIKVLNEKATIIILVKEAEKKEKVANDEYKETLKNLYNMSNNMTKDDIQLSSDIMARINLAKLHIEYDIMTSEIINLKDKTMDALNRSKKAHDEAYQIYDTFLKMRKQREELNTQITNQEISIKTLIV
jgi:hypothetical protein